MAAAGFGGILSDLAGVGTVHWVEYLASKIGMKPPVISAEQWDSSRARWSTNLGRTFGLILGSLIGMFPLLFYDERKTLSKKMKVKQEQRDSEAAKFDKQ